MCNWLQVQAGETGVETGGEEPLLAASVVPGLFAPLPVTGGPAAYPAARPAAPVLPAAAARASEVLSESLGSLVYGGLDGVITTFAIVSGVMGAQLSASLVLVLGLANLLGDGFSMATGAYLAAKSEKERGERQRERTSQAIASDPDGHRQALQQIYLQQGYSHTEAHWLSEINSRRPSRLLGALLKESSAADPESHRPLRDGLLTFAAFVLAGSAPLLTYLLDWLLGWGLGPQAAFYAAAVVSGLTLFALGAAKSRVTERSALRSGLEMLAVGGLAAGVAFAIGALLRSLGVG